LRLIGLQIKTKKLTKVYDNRGWLTEIFNGKNDQKIVNIHYCYSKPGVIRGNHYHKNKTELLYVTFGKGRLVLEENVTKERKEISMTGESPALVEIPPEVAHAIENNDSSKPMHLLVIEKGESNLTDADTFSREIIFKKAFD
jgi:UDP-2-acetamido-2,6-beta-L-arabino-hexul-4-ose reductase